MQRSAGIAAYIALCPAGGDQSKQATVLVPFGENHIDDIVSAFEYFVNNCSAVRALKKRPRVYYVFKSSV